MPWDIAQGVRQRVAALPPAAQALLGIAAVAGRRAPLGLLTLVSGRPEEEVLSALETAGRARLLVEDGAHAYRFAHDLVRQAIDTDLGHGPSGGTAPARGEGPGGRFHGRA